MKLENKQRWDPQSYNTNAGFVSELGMPVVEWLSPVAGESILDLGCGDGTLGVKLQSRGCEVVGVDSSPQMVAAARSRGLEAFVCDGHKLAFTDQFDAVFSNAALHWMLHPEQVISGVFAALKPGGRFVGEFGGAGNVATIVTALEAELDRLGISVDSPWFFPSPKQYGKMLTEAGFDVRRIELIPRPTALPGDVGGWLRTFAQTYTQLLPDSWRDEFIAAVVERVRPVLCDASGNWTADYVRLRFEAVLPRAG